MAGIHRKHRSALEILSDTCAHQLKDTYRPKRCPGVAVCDGGGGLSHAMANEIGECLCAGNSNSIILDPRAHKVRALKAATHVD